MTTYNPASRAAVTRGCTCPRDANQQGHGEPINDGASLRFYVALGCPLHSQFRAKEDDPSWEKHIVTRGGK